MMYCPECGADHHAGEREDEARMDREVQIAKINADRDIEIARLQAKADVAVAETVNDPELAHAEGVAEGLAAAVAESDGVTEETGEPGSEESEPAEVVIEATSGDAAEAVEAPAPPPEVEPAPRDRKKSGYWSAYR